MRLIRVVCACLCYDLPRHQENLQGLSSWCSNETLIPGIVSAGAGFFGYRLPPRRSQKRETSNKHGDHGEQNDRRSCDGSNATLFITFRTGVCQPRGVTVRTYCAYWCGKETRGDKHVQVRGQPRVSWTKCASRNH